MSLKHTSHNDLVGRIVNIAATTTLLLLISVAYFSAIAGMTPSVVI